MSISATIIPLCAFITICILYKDNALLPSHDNTAIPGYAHLFTIVGGIPENIAPLSTEPFFYPPGFVVFLSIISTLCGKLFTLAFFKYSCLFAVAMTPFTWGLLLKKQFEIKFNYINELSFYGLIYAAFFYMERTHLFALSYAGKNAQILMTMLLPVVLLILLKEVNSLKSAFGISFLLTGTYLCHYSFVYMLFGSIVAYLCVNFTKHKINFKYIILSLLLSVLLFIPWVLNLSFGGLGGSKYPGVLVSLNTFFHYFIDNNSPYLTVFKSFKFEPNANKNTWIIFSIIISSLYSFIAYKKEKIDFYKPVLFITLCVIGFGLLAAGFFPASKINMDYVRWFSYSFSALIMFIGILSLTCIIRLLLNNFLPTKITALCALVFVCGSLYQTIQISPDHLIKKLYHRNQYFRTSWNSVSQWSKFLSHDGTVYNLVTKSTPSLSNINSYHMFPNAYIDNYFAISNVRIINGSWYTAARSGSREVDSLPSTDFYNEYFKNPKALPLYYLASDRQAKIYESKIQSVRLISTDRVLDKYRMFKIIPNT